MKFGNYKFDSFWLSMFFGFLVTSFVFPYIFPILFIPLIFGLKKNDEK